MKKTAELQLLKKYGCDSSSVIKIVKMKYIRIDIKSTSRSRSYITTLFHSIAHSFPVVVKCLYQTELYSLNVLQLVRI